MAVITACAQACGEATSPRAIANAITKFQDALAKASHNPLLYGVESYLIRLLMELQFRAKSSEAVAYWQSRAADDFQEDRLRIARLLAARDAEATVGAMNAYLDDQRNSSRRTRICDAPVWTCYPTATLDRTCLRCCRERRFVKHSNLPNVTW